MAVQLKNRIEADLGIIVPLIQFLGPSVGELIPSIIEELKKKSPGPESRNARVDLWEEGVL